MRMKYILIFITSLFLNNLIFSQEVENDSTKKTIKIYKLRAGIDLYKPIFSRFNSNFEGIELVGDLNITDRIHLAAELGSEKKTIQSEQTNFTTKGNYLKLGIDYNFFNNWKGMDNSIYLGLRYGRSIHSHNINNYLVYITHHYWNNTKIINGNGIGERKNLSSGWVEFVFGIKTELILNFYLGISLRLNRILSQNQPDNFGNLYVPGFNKVTDGNNFGSGFNYTLTYSFPFKFKK